MRPTAPELAALATKYRRLAELRRRRDAGAPPEDVKAVLRELSAAFPGCLRELDTLGLAELERRAEHLESPLESLEPWAPRIHAFHGLLRAALALRRGERDAAVDPTLAEALRRPPDGHLSHVVLEEVARLFDDDAATLAEQLFPSRRTGARLGTAKPHAGTLLERLSLHHPSSSALAAERVSYGELLTRVETCAASLVARGAVAGTQVAFLAPPGETWVTTWLAIMRAGALAVPLSPLHPENELEHTLSVATPRLVIATDDLAPRLANLHAEVVPPAALAATAGRVLPPRPAPAAAALMLMTSGTTGRPKGVVTSHAALAATCGALHAAWALAPTDRLLHVLPLHHTHGVVVALAAALWAGAEVRFAPFDAVATWRDLENATVFMGVPTMYAKMLEASARDPQLARHAAGMRLLTSGSAALPASVFEAFRATTGHAILERYGMTEIGMALSNPLAGPRRPGTVGLPLPGVVVDVCAEDGSPTPRGLSGELRVRTPQLMSGYHGDPEATARAFDERGRFCTGDVGVLETHEDGSSAFRLLGRASSDILKSGGYKLSALEIEAVLRDHPAVADVAVIGQPDETWGDLVTACVVARPETSLDLDGLRSWARDRLAPYKLPRALVVVAELPRNVMGKVQKRELAQYVTAASERAASLMSRKLPRDLS